MQDGVTVYSVSVIVPTYNRCDRLKTCLQALCSQDYDPKQYEIIVCDDGSTDGTEELMRTLPSENPAIRYLKHENVGPAANRNIAILKAQGELLLFIDDDVIAGSNLLKEHYKTHLNNNNPKLVVLGYTPFALTVKKDYLIRYYENCWDRAYKRAEQKIKHGAYGLVITNNISLRRNFIVEAGLFDETFKYPGYEDSELGYRLLNNGMKLEYNRLALARHCFDMDYNSSLSQQYNLGLTAVKYFNKHPELKEALSIDSAIGSFDSPIGVLRRAARTIKPLFYNDVFVHIAGLFVRGFNVIMPDAISFKIIAFIHWHYYLKGIKNAWRKDNQ